MNSISAYQHIARPSPFSEASAGSRTVHAVTPADIAGERLANPALSWAKAAGFKAEAGQFLLVPDDTGEVGGALFGMGADPAEAPFMCGKLPRLLPAGNWRIETSHVAADHLALGFGLGSYGFDLYRSGKPPQARLQLADGVTRADIERQLAGVFLARDLVNIPTNELGPAELETIFRSLGEHYGASVASIVGNELLSRNFPLVHAVGRASVSPPRLLEMRWGEPGHPRITLVGKGVCFDTGGLDIKPASSMLLMKKDMGGAANVMGLALMIMDAGLKVDLRVLVPAVENSISGDAFRPGDIYRSRKGLTVQIDNTDAEGRLILADALAYADETPPDLMIDMSTLTGAARVALGTELAPYFTDDETLSQKLMEASRSEADPMWRLPLWMGYDKDVRARVADLTNAPSGGMAGAITAALFLKRFVTATRSWAHFDIFAWVQSDKPHAPAGGEAFAIRALYRIIRDMAAK